MLATQSFFKHNPTIPNTTKPGADPYDVDSYTKFLLHSNTSDGSTTFTDSSSVPHSISISGNTNHDTAQYKFGTTSIFFDGDDFLSWPDTDRLSFGREAFTIDFWMKDTSGGDVNQRIIGQGGGSGTGAETTGQWFLRPNMNSVGYDLYIYIATTYVGQGIPFLGNY